MTLEALVDALAQASNPEKAQKMEAYMKNKFSFYGVPSPERREILKNWKQNHSWEWGETLLNDGFFTFTNYKREASYCVQDLFIPLFKKYAQESEFQYITKLIVTNSWWDTVDIISVNLLGNLMKKFPNLIPQMIEEYNKSKNIWLIRSTLLFQLKYKQETDAELLFSQCKKYSDSKEFFIQKAMGWALRQYAKTAPNQVYAFVDSHSLPALTVREANKHRKV